MKLDQLDEILAGVVQNRHSHRSCIHRLLRDTT